MNDDEYDEIEDSSPVPKPDPSFGNSSHNDATADEPPSSIWDSDKAFETLKMERTVRGDETPEQMTKRLLEEAGPMAAQRIIHIALHSSNDNTSLAASKYITDKMYEDDSAKGSKAPWEELVAEAISQAELLANQGSGSNSGTGTDGGGTQ